jgi:hypothetical protein
MHNQDKVIKEFERLLKEFESLAEHFQWFVIPKGEREATSLSARWYSACFAWEEESDPDMCISLIKDFGDGMRWWSRKGPFRSSRLETFVTDFKSFAKAYCRADLTIHK